MVEEGKGTPSKRLTTEEAFAPVKAMIDAQIAFINTQIKGLEEQCENIPDTEYGRVQKQIGQLAIMVGKEASERWTITKWTWRSIMDTTSDIVQVRDGTKEQVRINAVKIVEEWLQSIEATKKEASSITLYKTA